jgi:type VI secretion system secreted protein Hcp
MSEAKKNAGKPRRPLLEGAFAMAATAMVAAPVPAHAETFLKLEGIKGESQDLKHKDEIEILSFTQSFINTVEFGTGGGAGAGKVQCGAVTMMKSIDASSPLLMKGVATGQHFKEAVITFRSGNLKAEEYYVITMQDLLISELSQTDSQDPNRIFEKLVLNARTFEFKYTPTTVKGSLGKPVSFKWDCAANKIN